MSTALVINLKSAALSIAAMRLYAAGKVFARFNKGSLKGFNIEERFERIRSEVLVVSTVLQTEDPASFLASIRRKANAMARADDLAIKF